MPNASAHAIRAWEKSPHFGCAECGRFFRARPLLDLSSRFELRDAVRVLPGRSVERDLYLAWLRDRLSDQLLRDRIPPSEWRSTMLRRARGRRALRREFRRWWQQRQLPNVAQVPHIPRSDWEEIQSRSGLPFPFFDRERPYSRPRGRPSILGRLPGEDLRPLVRRCVDVVDDWVAHLTECGASAEHHVRADGVWRDDSRMIIAARCYDRQRRGESLATPRVVLGALLTGAAGTSRDINTLATQLQELGRRGQPPSRTHSA